MTLGDDSDVDVVAVQVGGEELDGVWFRQHRRVHVQQRRWTAARRWLSFG